VCIEWFVGGGCGGLVLGDEVEGDLCELHETLYEESEVGDGLVSNFEEMKLKAMVE
jgi:hypothetical protein